jgi:hypothetical protein
MLILLVPIASTHFGILSTIFTIALQLRVVKLSSMTISLWLRLVSSLPKFLVCSTFGYVHLLFSLGLLIVFIEAWTWILVDKYTGRIRSKWGVLLASWLAAKTVALPCLRIGRGVCKSSVIPIEGFFLSRSTRFSYGKFARSQILTLVQVFNVPCLGWTILSVSCFRCVKAFRTVYFVLIGSLL